MRWLMIKTGALGDVLRTTSVLPGLARHDPELELTWLTAPSARPLVERHPRVGAVVTVDAGDPGDVARARAALLRVRWDRVLSFDDEEPLCALATELGAAGASLIGAHLDAGGARVYSEDSRPWFDMGLISRFGLEQADRLKLENRETHPSLFARMLGVEVGEPELPLPDEALAFAREVYARHGLDGAGPVIGLNTGAGGRWSSKRLPVERTAGLVHELERRLDGARFLLFGGPDEAERNAAIVAAAGTPSLVRAGEDHGLLEFASLVDGTNLLVTSDSLALHVAIARRRPVVAFFAPTSAAEIELYGRGEKVVSTAPDAGSYRPNADTSTLTVERLADAVLRVLTARPVG